MIMRVFNVNKAIGYASSGVEYAQKYRRQILKNIPWVEDFYIFTDYISTNLCVFSDLMDFPGERVIWIYNELAGRKTKPCSVTVEAFVSGIPQVYVREDANDKYTDLVLTEAPVRYRIWKIKNRFVDRVDTIVSNKLERVDHYDECLNNVEYYQENELIRRVFYTREGKPAFQQFYQDREITQTVIGGKVINGRSEFFQYFFERLLSAPTDVMIVDRALDVIDGIYPIIGKHRLFAVVHAEHYDLKQAEDDVLLWNNHYEHVFANAHLFEGIVVSTNRQKEVLEGQLAKQPHAAEIVCIPVGVVHTIIQNTGYEKYSIMTASRLAAEKHIDMLINAVIEAKKALPGIRFDIYGEGKRDDLEKLIQEKNAGEYITLKGHYKLDGLYAKYGLYVTASTSEGFGLSLMEALAEGLPIVGFEVEYGNKEMVENGVNGLLFPYENSREDITNLAGGIVAVLSGGNLDRMKASSREKAQMYLAENVQKRWEALLRGAENAGNI